MAAPHETRILRRAEHCISRQAMDSDALKVMYRLHRNGYKAYLVGGGVRDLLLGREPKDYDIGTDATPEQVLDLFRNSRVIGRRFPIVHVLFGNGFVVEVSTFRASDEEDEEAELPSDQDALEEKALLEAEADALIDDEDDEDENEDENEDEDDDENEDDDDAPPPRSARPAARTRSGKRAPGQRGGKRRRYDRGRHILEFTDPDLYGPPDEDARRRDLTINGLFYDIDDFSVIDHVGGLRDLENRVVRTIGPPDLRFRSDPVRMIRAIRHAGRLDFDIEPETWRAILDNRERLGECSKARVLEEFYRDLRGGAAFATLRILRRSGVMAAFLPQLPDFLPDWSEQEPIPLAWRRLRILDRHVAEGERFTPAFLLSLLFAFPMLDDIDRESARIHPVKLDVGRVAYRFLKPLTSRIGVARRDTERLFLISISQRRLAQCRAGQSIPNFFVNKPYFDDALKLFLFDTEARGEEPPELKFAGRRQRRRRPRRRKRKRPDGR